MAEPAEQVKAMHARRRAGGMRELRLVASDARSAAVRRRVAAQATGLDREDEDAALAWIEAVSKFEADAEE